MRYWPISSICNSPMLAGHHAAELAEVCRRAPSKEAYYACFDVARLTEPAPTGGLVIIESLGAPSRQAYTEYPSWEEWSRLERGAVIETLDGAYFILIDALH